MRGKHHCPAVGNLIELFDEHRAAIAKLIHHVAIVDDLFADINRSLGDLEGFLDHRNRANHSRAKSAEAGDEQFLRRPLAHQVTVSFSVTGRRRTRVCTVASSG